MRACMHIMISYTYMYAYIFYRDDYQNNYPANKTGNVNTRAITTDTALPGHKEEHLPVHVYETIKFQYAGTPSKDCSMIKSDIVSFSRSGMCHGPTKPTHYDKLKPSTTPKFVNVPKEIPVAKSHLPIPTTGDPSLQQQEYILRNPKQTPDNNDSEYVFMNRAKSDQYTSLSVTQSIVHVYEPLKH